jgi:hypothetical protein
VAALGGAVALARRSPRLALMLVPAPLAFLVLMGTEGRYFGRWLLPVFPLLCLLAAFFVLELASALAALAARVRRLPLREPALAATLVGLLCAGTLAQGLVYSVHAGVVLSRADTRSLTREWMLAHVPAGTPIVAEPVSPDEWAREVRTGTVTEANAYRWPKYRSLLQRLAPDGSLLANPRTQVGLEDYERTLAPALLRYYERNGYCVIVSGSTQSGRAFADPRAVPLAIAYYRTLEREAEVVYRASPYAAGSGPVGFSFDWSFDYYPLAYARPGPTMTVYRLRGGRCA